MTALPRLAQVSGLLQTQQGPQGPRKDSPTFTAPPPSCRDKEQRLREAAQPGHSHTAGHCHPLCTPGLA
jgi:hypothetical protein